MEKKTSKISFVGLHAHSVVGSPFDGFGYPQEHMDYAFENGSEALALTDHGNMNGLAGQVLHAKKMQAEGHDFKPIFGLEAYFIPSIEEWREEYETAMADKKRARSAKAQAASGDSSRTDDYDTMYATYVYGPVTFGYQVSNTDTYTAATADDEQTKWGVLYAVNDEMSISYQNIENDDSLLAVDEEATGISMSYTVGSMTFKAHRNKGTNLGNAVANESEHTELGVTFAF